MSLPMQDSRSNWLKHSIQGWWNTVEERTRKGPIKKQSNARNYGKKNQWLLGVQKPGHLWFTPGQLGIILEILWVQQTELNGRMAAVNGDSIWRGHGYREHFERVSNETAALRDACCETREWKNSAISRKGCMYEPIFYFHRANSSQKHYKGNFLLLIGSNLLSYQLYCTTTE